MRLVYNQESLVVEVPCKQLAGDVSVQQDCKVYRGYRRTSRRRNTAGAIQCQVAHQLRITLAAYDRGNAGVGDTLKGRCLSANRHRDPSEQGHSGDGVQPSAKTCHFLLLV